MFLPPLPPTAICDLANSVSAVLISGSFSMLAKRRKGVLMKAEPDAFMPMPSLFTPNFTVSSTTGSREVTFSS